MGLRFYLSMGLGRPVKGSSPMRQGWNVQHMLSLAALWERTAEGREGGQEAGGGRRPLRLSR